MSNCFFIGHRNTPEAIYVPLLESIKRYITEYGVSEFYVGHYGAFDCMASRALCEAKNRYPYIKNYLLLAYHPAIKKIDTPKGFECTLFLDGQEKSPRGMPLQISINALSEKWITSLHTIDTSRTVHTTY